ncbi:MAG: adenylate/guanylate cyclase domain-containing protein [Pseudomonadota bacterium]|nr:adenylate/guanylate cyclase domain-containing protein [Pseudomonadota bacterium]
MAWLKTTPNWITTTHLIGVAMLSLLWGMKQWELSLLETLRLETFDFYQKIKPREAMPTPWPVVIIDIDEASLAEFGQWPWPRTLLAELVNKLSSYRAGVVAFDIFFPEYDRLSPSAIATQLSGLSQNTNDELQAMPRTEEAFAHSLRNMAVVLGQGVLTSGPSPVSLKPIRANIVLTGDRAKALKQVPAFPSILRNVVELEEAAAGLGMVALEPEIDGIVRRVNMGIKVGEQIYPTLTLEMIRLALGQENVIFNVDSQAQTNSIKVRGLKQIGTPEIPTDGRFRAWVHFRPTTDTVTYISASDILKGEAEPDQLENALALIGTSALGLKDIRYTPLSKSVPGVEIHAQLLEMILTNSFLYRPPWARNAEVFAVVLCGLLMIIMIPTLGASYTLLFAFVLIGGMTISSWYAYTELRLLIDPLYPSLCSAILYITLSYMNFLREERQREQVRNAFNMYMSPVLVEQLAKEPKLLKLGGEMKKMTILFADIRGFTTISETYKHYPEQLTDLINKILTPLTRVILDRQGTIDKYMGDCVMAFWNAPLPVTAHPSNACTSALEMQKACEEVARIIRKQAEERAMQARKTLKQFETHQDNYSRELASAQKALALAEEEILLTIDIGIGINTDIVCVGNMGSDQRFDYSVLGDGVNLASRLEGQSKNYGISIIIGENTQEQVSGFALIELDLIQVKGKTRPTRVYGLLGDEEAAQTEEFNHYATQHKQFLTAYRAQKWGEAKKLSKICKELAIPWKAGGLYDCMEERLAEFRVQSPADSDGKWDGVYVAKTK